MSNLSGVFKKIQDLARELNIEDLEENIVEEIIDLLEGNLISEEEAGELRYIKMENKKN